MSTETTHIHLKHTPKDVKDLIEREQARMKLEENKKLKQEFVVYEMLRAWYKQQTEIYELKKQIADVGK
jgi:hypothetical protein